MAELARLHNADWPERSGPIAGWLVREARALPDAASVLRELCARLLEEGLPLRRASFHIRTLHPQLFATAFYWRHGERDIRTTRAEHGIERTDTFLRSPMRVLFEGAGAVRRRLDLPNDRFDFPIFEELRAEGLTDYVALPMTFSDGKIHGTTWSSDQPGGFASWHLALLYDLLPLLSLVLEIQLNRRIAINLLDTYVGHHAGARILEGQITRGSGSTVDAAIWYCDLRGFTALTETLPRDRLIGALNDYFERMAAPVEQFAGEILKFMGDGMLAVFPLEQDDAICRALWAAIAAREAMGELNRRRAEVGEPVLGFGIALHAGEVMYGNIGAPHRLDFTVIGPAVNQAVRIEKLCRTLEHEILISAHFAARCSEPLRSLGKHPLRGVAAPAEIYTVPEAV